MERKKDKLDKLIETRCCNFSAFEKIDVREMVINMNNDTIHGCDLFLVNEAASIVEKGRE